jgi:hypothetical protein
MTDDPHKRRKQIEENLTDLQAQRSNDVPRLTREASEQERNWKYANVDHVRGIIGGAELATVESEVQAARDAVTEATERQEVIAAAIKAEERALTRHLLENFDVFAADCMKVAEQIEKNRAKVNDVLLTMRGQHNQLHAKWAPLIAASKLQHNVPKLDIEPVPTIPLRPPGVGPDGKIITGEDEFGRPLGDVGLNREQKNANLLEQARREQAEAAARHAGITVPEGADAEAVMDAARAKSPEEVAAEREQHKREREANLQAAKG